MNPASCLPLGAETSPIYKITRLRVCTQHVVASFHSVHTVERTTNHLISAGRVVTCEVVIARFPLQKLCRHVPWVECLNRNPITYSQNASRADITPQYIHLYRNVQYGPFISREKGLFKQIILIAN